MSTKLHYYFNIILNRNPTDYEISAYGQKGINEKVLIENIRNIETMKCKSAHEILSKIDNHNAYMIFLDLFITKQLLHDVKNIHNHCIHFYINNDCSYLVDFLKYMYNCKIHHTLFSNDGVINVKLDIQFHNNYYYVLHNLYEVLSCIELSENCYIDLEYMYNFSISSNVPKSNNFAMIQVLDV